MEIRLTEKQKKVAERNKKMSEEFAILRRQNPTVSKYRCAVTLGDYFGISVVTVINTLKAMKKYD